jgi:hypothetical protein
MCVYRYICEREKQTASAALYAAAKTRSVIATVLSAARVYIYVHICNAYILCCWLVLVMCVCCAATPACSLSGVFFLSHTELAFKALLAGEFSRGKMLLHGGAKKFNVCGQK